MKKLIKHIDARSVEVLGADNKYHSIHLQWDKYDNLSDRTRDQILATGMLSHTGLPVTGWNNCIDEFIDMISMAALSVCLDAEEAEHTPSG